MRPGRLERMRLEGAERLAKGNMRGGQCLPLHARV